MRSDIRGLMAPRFMSFLRATLYVFVSVQYFVLFLLMKQAAQVQQLPIRVWLLPLLYPGPLVIGLAFKRNLNDLLSKELLTAKAAAICNDWITWLLCLVYGMLLEFRLLR